MIQEIKDAIEFARALMSTPTHGPCCTCQLCGEPKEDCYCHAIGQHLIPQLDNIEACLSEIERLKEENRLLKLEEMRDIDWREARRRYLEPAQPLSATIEAAKREAMEAEREKVLKAIADKFPPRDISNDQWLTEEMADLKRIVKGE